MMQYAHFESQKNSLVAGLCPYPLQELTALPRPPKGSVGKMVQKNCCGEYKERAVHGNPLGNNFTNWARMS